MSRLLPPSKLLPVTIVVTTMALAIKVVSLVTLAPPPGAFQAGTAQAFDAAGTASVISQARAAAPAPAAPVNIPQVSSPAPVKPVVLAQTAPANIPQVSSPAPAAPVKPAAPAQTAPVSVPPASSPVPGKPAVAAQTAPVGVPPPPSPAQTMPASVPPVSSPAAAAPGQPAAPQQAQAQATAATAASDATQEVNLRRSLIEEREQRLTEREAGLAAANKHMADRVTELLAIQARLEALESERKEHNEANWIGLVKLYETMRPRDAAVIFNALDKHVLLEIVDRMKPAKASPVIALMEPESARQVTAELAAKRNHSTTVTN